MPSKAQFKELFEQCKVKLDKDAKTITLTGGMTATGKDVSITPVALAIE